MSDQWISPVATAGGSELDGWNAIRSLVETALNRTSSMLDEDAAEIAAMRPVVEAARAFRHCGSDRGAFTTLLVALDAAVDAYEESLRPSATHPQEQG